MNGQDLIDHRAARDCAFIWFWLGIFQIAIVVIGGIALACELI